MTVLEEHGVEVSISSLRADSLTEDLVSSLARGGHRTLTMAPEAGTERLRRVIRKAITDEQLFAACDLLRTLRHPESQVLLHDRPAHGDPGGRRGDPRPGRAAARAPAGAGPRRRALRQAHALGVLVRAEAVDAVPVGGLRRPPEPRGQARRDQARRRAALACASCTRTRARPRCRPCSPAATGGWPTSSSSPPRSTATGGSALREWDGDAALYTRRERAVDEILPWDHFDVGVKKAGLLREWERALAEAGRRGGGRVACGCARRRWRTCRPGEGRVVEADGRALALFNVDGALLRDRQYLPASGRPAGRRRSRRAGSSTCPWHGWRWDVTTGPTPTTPRSGSACFPASVEDGEVFVELP